MDLAPLSRAFAQARRLPEARVSREFGLGLQAALAAARRAWPAVRVDEFAFVRHLARHWPAEGAEAEDLSRVHVGDLFLAFGAMSNDRTALPLLLRLVELEAHEAARSTNHPEHSAEVFSELTVSLIEKGRISDYSGRGALKAWLRTAATRKALGQSRSRERRAAAEGDALFDQVGGDPELSFIRAHHREDFRLALHAALRALSTRDRNVLRLQLIHRMSIDAIATVYGSHRATAARWIERAKQEILDETKRQLKRRLDLSRSEGSSLFRVLKDELDVSIESFLRNEPSVSQPRSGRGGTRSS